MMMSIVMIDGVDSSDDYQGKMILTVDAYYIRCDDDDKMHHDHHDLRHTCHHNMTI